MARRVKKGGSYPATRLGWHEWYAEEFNRTGRETAAHLSMWYLLLHLALD